MRSARRWFKRRVAALIGLAAVRSRRLPFSCSRFRYNRLAAVRGIRADVILVQESRFPQPDRVVSFSITFRRFHAGMDISRKATRVEDVNSGEFR
jgi:hypothetical protein